MLWSKDFLFTLRTTYWSQRRKSRVYELDTWGRQRKVKMSQTKVWEKSKSELTSQRQTAEERIHASLLNTMVRSFAHTSKASLTAKLQGMSSESKEPIGATNAPTCTTSLETTNLKLIRVEYCIRTPRAAWFQEGRKPPSKRRCKSTGEDVATMRMSLERDSVFHLT